MQSPWMVAASVALLALGVRGLYLSQIRQAPFFTLLMGDSKSYDAWAQRLAAGDWIGNEVFYQAPAYPYFLGAIYATLGRDLLAVRVVQSLLGAIACALLTHAAWRLFSRRAGVIAGLMLAFYAPAIFFDGLLQKTALDAFLTSVALWIVSGLVAAGHTPRAWFGLGVTMAALSLARENALLLVGVLGLWALWPGAPHLLGPPKRRSRMRPPELAGPPRAGHYVHRENALDARRHLLPFAAGLALLLLPVVARNAAVGGGFYLTTSQFGTNFYLGNNPATDGTAGALIAGRGSAEYERQDATELAQRAAGRVLTPSEVSSYWTGRALEFIRAQPLAWLRLMLRKAALLVNRAEAFDTESQEAYAEWSPLLRVAAVFGHFGLLIPLAVVGWCVTWKDRRRLAIFHLLTLAYAASVMLFFIYARYRFPLVPMLILFAAPGVGEGMVFLRSATRAQRVGLALAVLASVVITMLPLLDRRDRLAVTYHNMGAALQAEGQLDRAIESYRKAIAAKETYAPAYSNLGSVLTAKGDVAAARAAYERALALEPNFADAHFNLGNSLLAEGHAADAVGHYRQAIAAAPPTADVITNLGIALAQSGQADEGIRQLRAALAIAPDSATVRRVLGTLLAEQGVLGEATDHLRRAIALAPSDAEAHHAMGRLLIARDEPAAAIEHLRIAVRELASAEAHNDLGIALGTAGRRDEAAAEFQRALQLDPSFENARHNLQETIRGR